MSFRNLFLLFLSVAFLVPSVSHKANANDFAIASADSMGYRITMDKFMSGEHSLWDKDKAEMLHRFCKYVEYRFLGLELKKVKHNEMFHEIESQEQIDDIHALKQTYSQIGQKRDKDCMKRIKLWLDYDDKWYKAERDRKHAAVESLKKKEWPSEIIDTGDDIWDGVINGVYVAIPRKYIWFGSSEKDGYSQNMNLQFFYPNMDSLPLPDSDQKNERTNIAGLLGGNYNRTYPCTGFEGKTTCTRYGFQVAFISSYLDCGYGKKNIRMTYHHGIWRRICKLGRLSGTNLEVKYEKTWDEEVGMWRIDKDGYFEGDPEFPDYWFKCEKPKDLEDANTKGNRQCESAIQVNERMFFKYIFPRHLFWKHREIHEKLTEKLHGFVVRISDKEKKL